MSASLCHCCHLSLPDFRLAHLSDGFKEAMTACSLSDLFLFVWLTTHFSSSLCLPSETGDKVDFENHIIHYLKNAKERKKANI